MAQKANGCLESNGIVTFIEKALTTNVTMPFNSKHPIAFWIIMALAGLSMLALMTYWRRKRW